MPPQIVRVRSTAEQAQALSLAKVNAAMFGAAETGDLAKVEEMLAQGAQPDEFKNDRGFTALTAVCANGDDGHADTDGRDHWQVAERLIKAGAQLELKTMTSVFPLIGIGGTPLIYAADVGNVKTVDVLIKAGARVDEQSASLNTALICASVRGHIETVNRLIEAKASVDIAGEGGATAMMKAAYNGRAPVVEALIAAGTDINFKSTSGDTALVWTRKNGRPACEEILLKHGAIDKGGKIAGAFTRAKSAAKEQQQQ